MVQAKVYKLVKHFDGPPKVTDLKIVTEQLPPLKDKGDFNTKLVPTCEEVWNIFVSEFLAEAVYLSVDPYMRAYAHKLPIGSTMVGTQVARYFF